MKTEILEIVEKHLELNTSVQEQILKIAQEHLYVETLEMRGSDSLDFHDTHVLRMRDALLLAFEAGFEAGKNQS